MSLCPLQLGQEGKVPLRSAHLYYNVTEKVRHMMESYFRLEVPLHFSYSHLVCRTAIDGERGLGGHNPGRSGLLQPLVLSVAPPPGLGLDLSLETSLLLHNLLLPNRGCGSLFLSLLWEDGQLWWCLQWG